MAITPILHCGNSMGRRLINKQLIIAVILLHRNKRVASAPPWQAHCAAAFASLPAFPMKPVLPALAATFAIQILLSTSALVGPVLAPIAAADLGVDAARVGFFVSSIYIFAAPVGLISGGFIARFGGLRVSQVCLAAAAVALTLAAIGSVWLLPLVVILLGLGVGPSTPASSQILARLTPRHLMNLVFSIKQSAVPLGAALAGLALPSLAIAFGWNAAVLVAGVACLATAVFVQPLRGQIGRAHV